MKTAFNTLKILNVIIIVIVKVLKLKKLKSTLNQIKSTIKLISFKRHTQTSLKLYL